MNTTKNSSRAIRWGMAVLGIATLLATGLAARRLAPSEAATPSAQTGSGVLVQRDTIALPDVDTVSVQNMLPDTANIKVTFAGTSGELISTTYDIMLAESMRIYSAPESGADTVAGRVEAEADVSGFTRLPVFAVNFKLSDAGNEAYLGLQAWCDSEEGFHFYDVCLPYVVKGIEGWNTKFTIQPVRTNDSTDIIVQFYDQSGEFAGMVYTTTIPTLGSLPVDLTQIADIPAGFKGSAVVSSFDEIRVTSGVRMYNTRLGLSSTYAASDEAKKLIAPALFKVYGAPRYDSLTSELCVQNPGKSSSNVEVIYTDGVRRRETIASKASYCFDQGAEEHIIPWVGGARISSSEEIVAIVNVTGYKGGKQIGRWSYSVAREDQVAAKAVALPLLFNNFKNEWISGIYLYNVGGLPAVVTPRYVSLSNSKGFVYCAEPITLPAWSVKSIPQIELPAFMDIAMGYLTSTQPVAAVVMAASNKPGGDTDLGFAYEAGYPETWVDPQDACGTIKKIFLPIVVK